MDIIGQQQMQVPLPPGFRFHPTEEELLVYYLRNKICHHNMDFHVIHEVDLNKLEPWDIQERCKIASAAGHQTDWYLFSHKDKKYPSGTRTNRATAAGFWKATGRDKVIYSCRKMVGMRKTLVFYTGRAPHGLKSDWIMYEYRLDTDPTHNKHGGSEEGWVVCRVFKKRNIGVKVMPRESNLKATIGDEAVVSERDESPNITKWGAVDQLVACQLNCQTQTQTWDHHQQQSFSSYDNIMPYFTTDHYQQLQFHSFSSLSEHNNLHAYTSQYCMSYTTHIEES